MSEPAQVGYGKTLVDYDPSLPFYVKMAPLKRMPGIPFEEARLVARKIYQSLSEQPVLCLSGGIDSEAMALAFLAEGVPFRVATLCFANNLNNHDIQHAVTFCKAHNIAHDLVELDIVKFFNEGLHNEYLDKYICHSPEIAAQLWFLDQIRRPFVWAAEAFRVFSANEDVAIQAVSEYEAVIYRYVKRNQLRSIPNFHFYSSELAWSFFKESLKTQCESFPDDHEPEFYKQKQKFYLGAGFPVRPDSTRFQKLHGFEEVKKYFDLELKKAGKENYTGYFRVPVAFKYPITGKTYVDFPKTDEFVKAILS